MTLQVLTDLHHVLHEDAGPDLIVSNTSFLAKGLSQETAFDVEQNIIKDKPTLATISENVSLVSFCPEGFVGIGVPIDTDAFIKHFVVKQTFRAIIDDVEKFDDINDDFIHYQLLHFCQATRLQYLHTHILLGNRCHLQQQHVDCKISDALLKKGN